MIFNKLDKQENEHLPDLSWREAVVLVPILAGIFWIGLYPKPILDRMEPAAQHLIDTLRPPGAQAAR